MASKTFLLVSLAAFAVVPAIGMRLDPSAYEGGRSRDAEARAVRNSSAVANILGNIRTSMSDMMFLKTERYLDSGIAYEPHIDHGALSSTGETKMLAAHQGEVAAGSHEGHDHGDGAPAKTLIPTAKGDFRGFVGDMERIVKPWQDPSTPHQHTSGTELLPWYRLMTVSDPHNVRGYLIGGWWLKGIDTDEGLKFLNEGIANNPDAFQLPYLAGQVHMARVQAARIKKEPEAAILAEQKLALEQFDKAADLVAKARPADADPDKPTESWTNYQEEDARAALRMSVLMEDTIGDRRKALEKARKYLDLLKGDGVIQRNIAAIEKELAQGAK